MFTSGQQDWAQGDGIIHTDKKFEHIAYEAKHVEGRIFRNCTFFKCNLKGSSFEECTFERCEFDECDLSLLKLKTTSFNKTVVKNCKAIGILWIDATNPLSIDFINTRLSFCSFYGKSLKKMKMLNCTADEVDFTECNLSQSDFTGTDLSGAHFYKTDISKANFAGATNYFIDSRANKLSKAKFSLPEALSFLRALDIEIIE